MSTYIHRMNNFGRKAMDDERLDPSHISIYLALFLQWNRNGFRNPLSINRTELMGISKIGSNTTYLKCLHQLNEWDYIIYMPSKNKYKGSLVRMIEFEPHNDSNDSQKMSKKWTSTKQEVNPFLNSEETEMKTIREKPILSEIINYFIENRQNALEAQKFFNYYEAFDWKKRGAKIQNWIPLADNWIIKTKKSEYKTSFELKNELPADYYKKPF